ncbi:C-type lectin domain family 1 member A isoform X2 [Macaca thibetana thibetana]|uniref:C-type lectin domain family 1 member A isoform X2 n=1 Tax=Macaca thibetana thibetana TaxID=257877 RepID=UPI0021BCC453|nr:C-type lectin domain family 1 member A isoform X2 [Macaca thibetana thibetana]
MQPKYSSTRDVLDDDGDTTMSLHSQASATARLPEPRRTVFQYYQLSNTGQGTISQMAERLGNTSRELQSLQVQNRKLSGSLQHVAEKLCRELYNKTGVHRCSPCTDQWKWHGDKCYQFYKDGKSWEDCKYFCLSENCTMLKINKQEDLDFAMFQSRSPFFYSYWTGLLRPDSGKAWMWMDGTPFASELFEIIIDVTSPRSRDCVAILNGMIFSKDCQELKRCICERRAGMVKTESLHFPPETLGEGD